MMTKNKSVLALYADKTSHQWVVRDSEGNLWILPQVENCWDHRLPFEVTEESDLEVVPGHYRYLLDLPP